MNIKGVVGNLIPVDFTKLKSKENKTVQTQDRDPQNGGDQGAPQQHRFTQEELDEVLKLLKENPGIKNNNLQLRVEWNQSRVVVFVEDPTGKVVRRIPDTELWAILQSRNQSQRGTLLNKAL